MGMLYGSVNRKIVNLSTTAPSREMRLKGVFDLPTVQRLRFEEMVTFPGVVPPPISIVSNSNEIAEMVNEIGAKHALVEVPIFMVSSLERALIEAGIVPLYPWGHVYRYSVEADHGTDLQVARCAFKLINFIEICADGYKRRLFT